MLRLETSSKEQAAIMVGERKKSRQSLLSWCLPNQEGTMMWMTTS